MEENPSNKTKKCFITEEDTSIFLQRYSATDVLTLLQEMGQVKDVKIDWNKMARKTATSITNAREYQMVWRHLAYQDSLLDKIDNGAQPLDDDSDLECELEAFPAVSAEASAEAAACAKVLIASGLSSNAHGTNGSTMEAPLTVHIPQRHANCTSSTNQECSSSMRGKNIIAPISVKKQPLSFASSSDNLDITGQATGNGPAKKKRKIWSEQEDQELVEAVRQHGEGNWANLIKGLLKTDRTASQLSQRWSLLKKRRGMNLGGGPQLSEAQLATRHAVSRALDMPTGHNLKSVSSFKVNVSPDSRVKATAVAAGARIATPSDAASLRMAAQSKNAVNIKSGGGSMMKPSMPGNVNQLPSNVHFIRTGLINKPLSTHSSISNASRLGSSQPETDDVILGLGASGDQAVSSSLPGKDQMDQSLGTEAKEHQGKDMVSVPGRRMNDVQSNSLSNGDIAMASQSRAHENGASLAKCSNGRGDVNKDVEGVEKLEHMGISDVK